MNRNPVMRLSAATQVINGEGIQAPEQFVTQEIRARLKYKNHQHMKVIILAVMVLLMVYGAADAQLPRERVETDDPVDNVFRATTNIGISTVRNLSAHTLNSTVLHTFGIIHGGDGRRGIDSFFGLDDGANTRIGLAYGITDKLSVNIGRMTFNKIVDFGGKYNVFRQTTSNSMPIELAVKTSVGINTTPGTGFDFSERLTYFGSVMIARKFDGFSLQLTPMMAHFSRTAEVNPEELYGLGFLVNYELNDRFAISGEYLPVIGDRNVATHDAVAVALNIDTGGHVFQLFFTSSQWHNEPFIMANNRDRFWKGDFRFGFNIHRVFGTGR